VQAADAAAAGARGEQAQNKALKEKHKRRKKRGRAEAAAVAALQESNEDSSEQPLLNVYNSIQEEVPAKRKMLEKMQEKTEIKDLQLEFGLEKMDYLSTIRCDCSYCNLDKIRRESIRDEESGCWKIPEPVTQKPHLP
ncbi:KIF17 protein, partial [Drymodes brunneopygia]|nr:KIF17 protein [Drymodes brunneopygia]